MYQGAMRLEIRTKHAVWYSEICSRIALEIDPVECRKIAEIQRQKTGP